MRETQFIQQKSEQWTRLEEELKRKNRDPELLSELFVQVTDDLSYARTFYPNRSVRVYLNGLAQQLFFGIYKNKPLKLARFWSFWREDLPDIMWQSRRILAWATLIFVVMFCVGWFSSAMDKSFDRVILGDSYIQMTKANIAKGDPLGVYKDHDSGSMFLMILGNNLKVDFLTFAMGIFWGIGAVLIMVYNGVMTGTFQHFFYAFGGFRESLFTIWVHGAFEISAMVLSAVAGMEMGRGLVFPGTYSRLQAFQLSARRGFKILIGVCVITLIAAFNESFLTRFTDAPYWLRGALIATSFGFVFFYFVWYPRRRYYAGLTKDTPSYTLPPDDEVITDWTSIKTIGEIIKDTFRFMRRHLGLFFGLSVVSAVGYMLALRGIVGGGLAGQVRYKTWSFFAGGIYTHAHNLLQFLDYSHLHSFFVVANTILFAWLSVRVLHCVMREYAPATTPVSAWRFAQKNGNALKITAIVCLLQALLLLPNFGFYFAFGLLPVAIMWQFVMLSQQQNLFRSLQLTSKLLANNYGYLLGLYAVLLLVSFAFSLLSASYLLELGLSFVQWNLSLQKNDGVVLMRYILAGLAVLMTGFILPLFVYAFAALSSSFNETNNAAGLRQHIAQIGQKREIRGVLRE